MTKNQRAFTIIEVLLAITLIGIVMTTIYSVYTGSLKTIKSGTAKALFERKLNILFNIIQHDMQNAFYPRDPKNRFFKVVQDDRGNQPADKIDLITIHPVLTRYSATSELREVGYFLKEAEPSKYGDILFNLYRREQIGIDDKPEEGGDVALLARRVYSFRVECAGNPGRIRWVRRWDFKDRNRYPAGIRITLEILRSDDLESKKTMVIVAPIKQDRPL